MTTLHENGWEQSSWCVCFQNVTSSKSKICDLLSFLMLQLYFSYFRSNSPLLQTQLFECNIWSFSEFESWPHRSNYLITVEPLFARNLFLENFLISCLHHEIYILKKLSEKNILHFYFQNNGLRKISRARAAVYAVLWTIPDMYFFFKLQK